MRARMGLFTTIPPLWKFRTMDRTSYDVLREKVHIVATIAAVGGYYRYECCRYEQRVLKSAALRGGYDNDAILRLTRDD